MFINRGVLMAPQKYQRHPFNRGVHGNFCTFIALEIEKGGFDIDMHEEDSLL